MNIRAKCSNPKCSAAEVVKSVAVGQMLGYGAPNDRVRCPLCGELMTTTESIDTSSKGRGKDLRPKRNSKRYPKRDRKRSSKR